MRSMTMRSWVRQLLTRPVTHPIRKAQRRTRPWLVALEDRTAPAVVTYTAATDLLDFTAGVGKADNVSVTAPAANTVRIVVAAGDTITLTGDTGTGFTLSAGNTQ